MATVIIFMITNRMHEVSSIFFVAVLPLFLPCLNTELMANIRLVTDDANANGSRKSILGSALKPHFFANKAAEQNSSGTKVEPITTPSGSAPMGAEEGADVVRHFQQTKQQLVRDDAAVRIDATDHMRYL